MSLNSFLDATAMRGIINSNFNTDSYRRMCAEKALTSTPQKRYDKTILFYESNPEEIADCERLKEFLKRSNIKH